MDIVKHVLSEIKDGNSKFTPISDSKSDVEDFQAMGTIGDVHWIIGLQTISCMISR